MATPFSEIYNIFHSKFQSSSALPDGLEQQWLINSFSDLELALGKRIDYDVDTEQIATNLTNIEKQLLGKMLYKYYAQREYDRVTKMANFVGKDIKFTSYGDKTKTFEKLVNEIEKEINYDISRML